MRGNALETIVPRHHELRIHVLNACWKVDSTHLYFFLVKCLLLATKVTKVTAYKVKATRVGDICHLSQDSRRDHLSSSGTTMPRTNSTGVSCLPIPRIISPLRPYISKAKSNNLSTSSRCSSGARSACDLAYLHLSVV